MSVAPASTSSVLVAVSGVLQDPSTYSVSGTTLTFSGAPPSGTSNISVRFLGIPASGVTTTAYRTTTEFTATASQTTFSVPSYTVGFIDVYRNGVMLGSADYTATNGTTVVLATGATAGDLIEVISFQVSSVLNAIPATAGSVGNTFLANSSVTAGKLSTTGTASASTYLRGDMAWSSLPASGKVLQVVQGITPSNYTTSSGSYTATGYGLSITPTSSSSKILILLAGQMDSGVANNQAVIQVRRATTDLGAGTGSSVFSAANRMISGISVVYLDSPATTSSTTYNLYFLAGSSSTITWYSGATLTLMEIAA
jgi:hypothetical protein